MMNGNADVGLDVGFLGLGQMGAAMAERLLPSPDAPGAPGMRLHVHDPVAAHMAPFVARGAQAHGTARSVADAASVVLACLPSPAVSLQVAKEVAGGAALSVYVEMSTIGRPAIDEIAALLAPHRIGLVDAPVSGGPDGARAGTLAMMAAGDPAAVERVRPHLARMAGRLFDVGPVAGQAQAMKLVNNLIAAATLAVTAEALVAGAKAGLAGQTMIDVINQSSGQNNATRWLIPGYVLNGGFNFGATIGTMLKDVELALAEAASLGVAMPVNTAAAERWRFGFERLGPQSDLTRFVQVLEDLAQVKLRGDGAA